MEAWQKKLLIEIRSRSRHGYMVSPTSRPLNDADMKSDIKILLQIIDQLQKEKKEHK